jgi:hypothetical protein
MRSLTPSLPSFRERAASWSRPAVPILIADMRDVVIWR